MDSSPTNSASILLLMSDDVERLRLEQILRLAGHEVTSVHTVNDASKQLVAEPLDLFICEFDRRDEDRISLLTAAKWRLPYLARLLLSRKDDARVAQRALETGIVHFTLVPPVSQSVLLDTTKAMLQWAQQERLGTPAPQTDENTAVRSRLRETLDDDQAWEQTLTPLPERKRRRAQGQGQDQEQDRDQEQDQDQDQESKLQASSSKRGRVEWYY